MSTKTKQSYKLSVKRATTRRRRRQQQKRTITPSIFSSFLTFKSRRSSFKPIMENEGNLNSKSKLSQKLQALKNLIPAHDGDSAKPDQLFKETADYIVLLKTRVVILQKLIEFYGNNPENENSVLL